MNGESSKIIKRIMELHREENRKFLEATERYVKFNDSEALHEAGEHGYASSILAKLLLEFV